MGTSYSDIYGIFSNKITDYSFDNITEADLAAIFKIFLNSAVTKFTKCKQDLTLRSFSDDTPSVENGFDADLTDVEIEILANMMITEWLSPKLYTSDLLKQMIGVKDYTMWSQANQIKELRELKNASEDDVNRLMMNYIEVSIDDLS